MRVAIIYGWAEGSGHGKKLRRSLRDAGFTVTKYPELADIIVAHSGGCFMLPSTSKATVLLLVGLPYWPGIHPLWRLKHKLRAEDIDLRWVYKTILSVFYFLTRPLRWHRMYRSWRAMVVPVIAFSARTILVRNNDDCFLHPNFYRELARDYGWEVRDLPGGHDDIWYTPERYVELIKSVFDKKTGAA